MLKSKNSPTQQLTENLPVPYQSCYKVLSHWTKKFQKSDIHYNYLISISMTVFEYLMMKYHKHVLKWHLEDLYTVQRLGYEVQSVPESDCKS